VKVGGGVRSDAVTIEAATPEHLRLLLDDVPGFVRAYDLRVAPGYMEFDRAIAGCLAALEDGRPARWRTRTVPGSTNRGGGA
jgi:hypothetical protein